MIPTTYLGLDIAEDMGAALYFAHSQQAHVFEYNGTPVQQWKFVKTLIYYNPQTLVCMELMHHFRNAITTRSVFGRYGFIKWSSVEYGYTPREISHQVARSFVHAKGKRGVHVAFLSEYRGEKQLTDNHTDALAIAMFAAHLDGLLPEFKVPEIEVR